ncbi:hypothetical protein ACFE04_016159 [Oxalis oulophora]
MASLNFEALRDLHNSANDLLHSPEVKQELIDNRQEKFVHEVSEASLKMLELCGVSKDVLLLIKEHLQDLQLTLRRDSDNISTKLSAYNQCRKNLRRETLKCLKSLKGLNKNKSNIGLDLSSSPLMNLNLMVVVDVLKEVRVTTISIVESLLSLISIPWLDNKNKRSLLKSKLCIRSRDLKVYDICDENIAVESANKRLEAVEIAIEELEVELECIFRRLIQTRVSLLNILTIEIINN